MQCDDRYCPPSPSSARVRTRVSYTTRWTRGRNPITRRRSRAPEIRPARRAPRRTHAHVLCAARRPARSRDLISRPGCGRTAAASANRQRPRQSVPKRFLSPRTVSRSGRRVERRTLVTTYSGEITFPTEKPTMYDDYTTPVGF